MLRKFLHYIFINLILCFCNLEIFSNVMRYHSMNLDFTNQNRIYLQL